MSFSADLRRLPTFSESALLCLEVRLCVEVLRAWAGDLSRRCEDPFDVAAIVPGKATMGGVGGLDDAVVDESVERPVTFSDGVGKSFAPALPDIADAVMQATGVQSATAEGVASGEVGAVRGSA